jgi:hypothetical protein
MDTIAFKKPPQRTRQEEPRQPGADWVSRRAKLFEAGEYPDKGVTVTPDDLSRLATSFAEPVPVLIEHADSPLEIGLLTGVEVLGQELFGVVSLTPEANALVERSGARSLSVGLAADLSEIREVSLVRSPRVPTAQIYCDSVLFAGSLQDAELSGEELAVAVREVFASDAELVWRARYERLEREQVRQEAERKVGRWITEGRLTPAQAPIVAALLMSPGIVEFDGQSRPVSTLIEALVLRQPILALFTELAPGASADPSLDSALLLPEEAAFYRRHFPDVSLEEIARRRH